MIVAAVLTAALAAAPAAWGQSDRLPATDNVLTRYLDWADIHSAVGVGRLTVFPISLARPVQRLGRVLTMQQALDRGVLTIEELARARVAEARFTNKSRDHMIFLMNGELITGGRQNRVLRTDALLGPSSSTVLPTYCVEKGRWSGPQLFRKMSSVVPQGVRERAAGGAGQDAVWSEVKAANKRLGSSDAAEDMHKAMAKPENARRLREYRGRIVPRLPRGCVGLVVATGGRIVAADLFQTPELLTAMRDKVRAFDSLPRRGAEILILRSYRSSAFDAFGPLYEQDHERRPHLDLPFRERDYVGAALPPGD